MSRLYSYLFGHRHQQEVEMKLKLLEKKLEGAEIRQRDQDAKIAALLDRVSDLEAECKRHKTAQLQQKTALEEQLVHVRQTRSNSIVHPLQPISDNPESKPAMASAEVFLVNSETAQPIIALKFADCIDPGRRDHTAEISAQHLDETFLKSKLRAVQETHGQPAAPEDSLYRCDTMSRINDSEELGMSANEMYQSNEKGQIAYCLCNGNIPRGMEFSIHSGPD